MEYLTYSDGQNYDAERALECFEKAADKGSELAVYLEAFVLDTALPDTQRFYEGALDKYQEIDDSIPWAYSGEAELYKNGRGTTLDEEMSETCYELFFDAIDEEEIRNDSSSVNGLYWYVLANAYEAQGDSEEAIKWLEKSAEDGFVPAINDLGIYYVNGEGLFLEADTDKARELFTKAAKCGYGSGYDNLGQMEVNKVRGENPDYEKASTYYEKAVKVGNSNGYFHLGQLAEYGLGRTANFNDALEYYEKAANAGNIKAIRKMGLIFSHEIYSDKIEQNYNTAVSWFEEGAKYGDADSMYYLGLTYYTGGAGFSKNMVLACEWFLRASDKGNNLAMNYLGVFLQEGMGTSVNIDQAVDMYIKSADHGNVGAMYNLGFLYENDGERKDLSKAFEWYKKAADAGFSDAMFVIGEYYYSGISMDASDFDRAFYYYLQGAKSGNVNAMNRLADMYLDGLGCNQNFQLAKEWYENVLKEENDLTNDIKAHALYGLGLCYEQGEDKISKAIACYEEAAELGKKEAKTELGRLYLMEETIKDYDKAFSYLSEASKDDSKASELLGNMYFEGLTKDGVDYYKAYDCYIPCLDAGNMNVCKNLYSVCILLNQENRFSLSVKGLNKLVEADFTDAKNALGEMYYWGNGVDTDYDRALTLFADAADEGNTEAMKNMGDYYTLVLSDEASITKGIAWYKKAYDKGNDEAGKRLKELGVTGE